MQLEFHWREGGREGVKANDLIHNFLTLVRNRLKENWEVEGRGTKQKGADDVCFF